jgi:hypothetical protein
MAIYLCSHLARMVRMALLLGGVRIRRLFALYWFSSAVSLAVPLKLGELARVVEIGAAAGAASRGLLVVWVERAFDVALLGAIVAALVAAGSVDIPGLAPMLVLIGVFVAVSVIVLRILPENFDRINLHVMRAYRGEQALRMLRTLARARSFADEARRMLNGRFATLAFLTVVIWGLELVAVSILLDPRQPLTGVSLELLAKLGAVLSGAPVAGGEAIAFLALAQGAAVEVLALLCLLPYARWRLSSVPHNRLFHEHAHRP